MLTEARVAWREGLFLRQQHFQQQDRHLDAVLGARLRAAGPYPWGVTELSVDRDLAALGKFAVERLTGIMPDGTPFSIPGDLPPPRPMDIPQTTRDTIIYLTLPAHQPGALAFAMDEGASAAPTRYVVQPVDVPDVFAEERPQETIEVARPNLSFGFTRDQTYGRVTMGLARIREVSGGGISFDDRYIPPALDITASPRLAGFLSDIIGRCEQRVDELALRAVEATDGGTETIANFLLLQALNRYRAQLSHLSTLPMVHPERLYEVLCSMCGDLSTLTSEARRPAIAKPYEHDRLQQSFEPLVDELRAALAAIYDRAAFMLPLVEAAPGAFTARTGDPSIFRTGFFFLAVSANASLEDVRARFPSVAKIGPVQKMRQIVDSALTGISLRHTPTPPPQIRPMPGHVYFELDRSAEEWPSLATSPALGLHVAGDWPGLKLELWCVKKVVR